MTCLAFLRLSDARFGGILPVLLPSCSRMTYSANTQWVITESRAEDERRFPKIPRLQPACLDQSFTFGCEQRFSDGNRLFGNFCAMGVQ